LLLGINFFLSYKYDDEDLREEKIPGNVSPGGNEETLKGRLGVSCLEALRVKTMVCGPHVPLCAPSQHGLETSGGVCMLSHVRLCPHGL